MSGRTGGKGGGDAGTAAERAPIRGATAAATAAAAGASSGNGSSAEKTNGSDDAVQSYGAAPPGQQKMLVEGGGVDANGG